MRKKQAVVKFNISLAVFYTFAMTKLNFMLRDLAEFVQFGITDLKINALRDLLTAFQDIPTDEELLGAQMAATQEKDSQAEQVRDTIADIMMRVENRFGFRSGMYQKFGVSNLSKIGGGKLLYIGRRVHRNATGLLTELADEGLSQEMLDAFKLSLDNYEVALAAQEDAIADRDIATENRIDKANEIYVLLSRYCDTGKRIWESVNEAKYNDYIIYDTPSGEPEL